MKKNQQENSLINFSKMDLSDVYREFETSEMGLYTSEVEERLEEYGKNIIITKKKKNMFLRLLESIINPFNVILMLIGLVTLITDVVIAEKADWLTVIIIYGLVLISSLISFIQNERSNNAAEALSKMVTNDTLTKRDLEFKEVLMENIVPGDIIKLSAGDMIPADVRFIQTKDTFVAQSALTGESQPVEKFSKSRIQGSVLTDIDNIGFLGTNIISGSAIAVVLSTGNDTYFGSMSKTLSGDRTVKAFERGIRSISKLLLQMILITVPIVLLLNGFLKGDWVRSIIFAITIAVGLTPEMLPVIMTTTLARGAMSMSKHKVIVKKLDSIQTFGEMNILCTDKTGTLTEDKIVLEKYINTLGHDDTRVLRHAYLNSYFQTGLKNLIDIAIVNQANSYNIEEVLTRFTKVDEIPFDFNRRRMSVVLKDPSGKRQLITKGAVEEMIKLCKYIDLDGKAVEIGPHLESAMATYHSYAKQGLRVLAVAQKNEVPAEHIFSVSDESDMVLMGFVGFLDPPKESAAGAIKLLAEHGVRTIVLTGDSELVTKKVCSKIGMDTTDIMTGEDIKQITDDELYESLKTHDIYAKLSPHQKKRIITVLQRDNTVGFMGDGINDSPALHQADVGISVDNAVDIAKETADIILLEKDLMVLEKGVVEGRKTFGNIMKYLNMQVSGNFGNIFSVIIASIFLPFLPMLPIHLLVQNLLLDFSQFGMAFDNVDKDYLKKPQKWNWKKVRNFTLIMGPLSSIFDILCFLVLWYIIGANTMDMERLFQAGWFVFVVISQVLIIYVIRSRYLSFSVNKPAKLLLVSTLLVIVVALLIGFTNAGIAIDFTMKLPITFMLWLFLLSILYIGATELTKKIYIKVFGEWI